MSVIHDLWRVSRGKLRVGLLLWFGSAAALCPSNARAKRPTSVPCHSHNDYEREQPLKIALFARFQSVEADLWLSAGKIMVAHWPWAYAGSLEDLYLMPLKALLTQRKTVHEDGKPFFLWLDLKDGRDEFRPKLAKLLCAYSHISPAVQVVLTGSESQREKLLREYPLQVQYDHGSYRDDDPESDGRWTWYSLAWRNYFHWRGHGEMPETERLQLREMIAKIHAKGRHVRFYEAPETAELWRLLAEEGVDLIGTDQVGVLGKAFKFLTSGTTLGSPIQETEFP